MEGNRNALWSSTSVVYTWDGREGGKKQVWKQQCFAATATQSKKDNCKHTLAFTMEANSQSISSSIQTTRLSFSVPNRLKHCTRCSRRIDFGDAFSLRRHVLATQDLTSHKRHAQWVSQLAAAEKRSSLEARSSVLTSRATATHAAAKWRRRSRAKLEINSIFVERSWPNSDEMNCWLAETANYLFGPNCLLKNWLCGMQFASLFRTAPLRLIPLHSSHPLAISIWTLLGQSAIRINSCANCRLVMHV